MTTHVNPSGCAVLVVSEHHFNKMKLPGEERGSQFARTRRAKLFYIAAGSCKYLVVSRNPFYTALQGLRRGAGQTRHQNELTMSALPAAETRARRLAGGIKGEPNQWVFWKKYS